MFLGGGGPILADQTSVMCWTITAMSLIMAVAAVWSMVILMAWVGRPISFFSCCQYLRGLLARSSASLLMVSIQWWWARILPSSRMSWTVFRLCLLSARWVLRSLVLLWWSVSLHRIDVSLLNRSETEIKGLVQIVVWGIACCLASCIALIFAAIDAQTSFCVACLRFIGFAESGEEPRAPSESCGLRGSSAPRAAKLCDSGIGVEVFLLFKSSARAEEGGDFYLALPFSS